MCDERYTVHLLVLLREFKYSFNAWLWNALCLVTARRLESTGYGLVRPGIESRWGEVFRTCPDRPWGPLTLLHNGYRVFDWGKEQPGRDADPSSPSSAVVKKE